LRYYLAETNPYPFPVEVFHGLKKRTFAPKSFVSEDFFAAGKD